MTTEMLAGDELAPADASTLRATGFLARNWEKFNRNTWLETTIEHTAKALLGATMNCCRCHDHKFDPISQVEYYQFRAIFEPHEVRTERVPGEPDAAKDGLARVCDLTSDAPTYVFERGDEKRPKKDKVIKPGVPEAFGGSPLQIHSIDLPTLAYYPALQEFAINEEMAKKSATIVQAEAALAKARTAIASAKTKKDEKSMPTLVAAAELAVKQVATARAARASYDARVAAEKAKYGLTGSAGVKQLAEAAAKLERELALCQAQEQQAAAAHELVVARNALKPGDPKSANAVAAEEQKVAAS